jgi:hypothetical protein
MSKICQNFKVGRTNSAAERNETRGDPIVARAYCAIAHQPHSRPLPWACPLIQAIRPRHQETSSKPYYAVGIQPSVRMPNIKMSKRNIHRNRGPSFRLRYRIVARATLRHIFAPPRLTPLLQLLTSDGFPGYLTRSFATYGIRSDKTIALWVLKLPDWSS